MIAGTMASPSQKIIVTNLAALRAKYGAGVTTIQTAVAKLVAADKVRGITTKMINVANAAAMKAVKGSPVTNPQDQKQNKAAIDAIYTALVPDYLMILGSIDVIPHQDMVNPVFDGSGDPDRMVPGDLPYACDAPYSTDPAKFIGPTRVVGRLPDLTGGTDPMVLTGVLATAEQGKSRPPGDYRDYLGISAQVWSKSSALSLQKLYGESKGMKTSPTSGPTWTAVQIKRRAHFINCHGAAAKAEFYGQKGQAFPIAHTSAFVAGKLSDGTVASVECCYGAQLYDPTMWGALPGLGNTYLSSGAYGYFGSSTISYGPEDANAFADLICQYFLQRVLVGASLGRAVLEARQQFAQGSAQLDPYDLKTLAQFNLLGDPSLHPVQVPSASRLPATPRGTTAKASGSGVGREINRADRRRVLIRRGLEIAATQPVARRAKRAPGGAIASALRKLAAASGMDSGSVLSFDVENPPATVGATRGGKALALLSGRSAPEAFHVMATREDDPGIPSPQVREIVAKEVAGKIVSYRMLRSR